MCLQKPQVCRLKVCFKLPKHEIILKPDMHSAYVLETSTD